MATDFSRHRQHEANPDVLDSADAGPAAIQGAALRTLGYGAGVLMSVGSAALLFRHLGVVDAGRYVTALSLVAIAGGVSDLGIAAIGLRELAVLDAADRQRFVRNLLGLRMVLTGIGICAAVLFTIAAGYPSTVVAGTALAGVGLMILSLQSTLAAGLMVELRMGWVTLAELLRQLLTTLLIIGLVIGGAALLPFFAISIPATAAALAVTILLVRGQIPVLPSFEWSEWRGLLREILPFAAAAMLGVVYFRLAIVLLSLVSTTRETGYFGVSFRIIEVLVVVPQLLVSGAFPIFARAARDDRDRLAYGVQRVFEAGLIGGVGVGLALALGAPVAIDVVGGAKFEPAIGVLQIQAVALAAMFANASWIYALLSLRRSRTILWLSVSGVLLNGISVAIFASIAGARGAAWATMGVDLIQTGLAGFALGRAQVGLRPSLAVVPRVALAAGVAGALAAVPGISALPLVAGAIVVYGTLVVGLGAVPREIVVEFRRSFRTVQALVSR